MRLIATEPELEVVQRGEEADIAVFDLKFESADTTQKLMRRKFPRMRYIAVVDNLAARESRQLVMRGFWGAVTYETYTKELIPAVKHLTDGRLWFPAQDLTDVIATHLNSFHLPEGMNWTQREGEILDLLSRGMCNKEIANLLGITERTVKFHVSNVFQKLGVHSRREVVRSSQAFPVNIVTSQ